jgi:hypothetical protein
MEADEIMKVINNVNDLYEKKRIFHEKSQELNKESCALSNNIIQAAKDLAVILNRLPEEFRKELGDYL